MTRKKIAFYLRSYHADLYSRVSRYLNGVAGEAVELTAVFSDAYNYARYKDAGAWARAYCLSQALRESKIYDLGDEQEVARVSSRYGNDLWGLAYADRALACADRRTIVPKLVGYARFLEDFLAAEKPDCFILCELALSFELMALRVAEQWGVRCLVPFPSRLPYHRISFIDNLGERWIGLKESYEAKKRRGLKPAEMGEVERFIRYIAEAKKSPVYKEVDRRWSTFRTRLKELGRLQEYLGFARYYFTGDRGYSHLHYQFQQSLVSKLGRTVFYYYARKLVPFDRPRQHEKFFLFPLQVYPEYSLSVLAPFATNQVAVAENIARCLPLGYLLYVKENEGALGWRPRGFYKALLRMPNVRLIDPGLRIHDLIERAQGVIVITATTGLEALVMGKPVITIGETFFNDCDEVLHVDSFERLKESVSRIVRGQFAYSERRLAFLHALLETSRRGEIYAPFHMPYTLRESNIADLGAAILEKAGAGTCLPAPWQACGSRTA